MFASIQPIDVSYSEQKSDSKYGLKEAPNFMYQMGWTRGDSTWISDVITNDRAAWNSQQRLTLKSGFNIQKAISVSLNYSLSDNTTLQSDDTQKKSNSALILGETDGIPFPAWTVNWKGLEKLPIIKIFAKRFDLKHAYTGQVDETFKNGAITQDSYIQNFRPFIGGSLNFKFGMDVTFDYKTSKQLVRDRQATTTMTRSTTSDINVTARYRKRGGLTLPFFKGKKLDNSIDFTLTYRSSSNIKDKSTTEAGKFSTISKVTNWSIRPEASYSFSKNVNGGFHLEYGKSESLKTEDKRTFALGINAVINLSGR